LVPVDTPAGELNALDVVGRRLLLVETGGSAVHLADACAKAGGRAAVPAAWLAADGLGYASTIAGYDVDALNASVWSTRALCGVQWHAMAAGAVGPLRSDQDIQLAPTCRRCLTSVDRMFPTPEPDGRVAVLAEVAARAVQEHGSAEVYGVPGDQVRPFRDALRREFRRRFGHTGRTWLVDDVLLASCDEATETVRLAQAQAVVNSLYSSDTPADDSAWRLRWHTWG
jgi:hypothetical protein